MKKTLFLLSLVAALTSACSSVRPIGELNGCQAARITTRGVFSPSTTTVVYYNTNKPGTIEGTLANASGPSFLGQVTDGAAIVGASYVRRPDSTKVSQSGGGAVSSSDATANQNQTGPTTTTTVTGGGRQNGSVHHNNNN